MRVFLKTQNEKKFWGFFTLSSSIKENELAKRMCPPNFAKVMYKVHQLQQHNNIRLLRKEGAQLLLDQPIRLNVVDDKVTILEV